MRKYLFIILLPILAGCSLIQEDLLGLDIPADICEVAGESCYMENGEKVGECRVNSESDKGLNCSDCGICLGCSITNLETCVETSCQINQRDIQLNPRDPRRFSHMDHVRVVSQETCDDLKSLGNQGQGGNK